MKAKEIYLKPESEIICVELQEGVMALSDSLNTDNESNGETFQSKKRLWD